MWCGGGTGGETVGLDEEEWRQKRERLCQALWALKAWYFSNLDFYSEPHREPWDHLEQKKAVILWDLMHEVAQVGGAGPGTQGRKPPSTVYRARGR